ncbi:hypothetical protein NEILACOT_03346 [Neisseria lactamica ATCC 23970]|uniref:Uncharacterized protein n=1 Tax=Neisseria lactamica ATCC 23970 TaxID=546265 RepID=D0W750_NEILA|nr:hypothetical protein NEILACOT_03346 [Neisseria lactamica ATCC 23970]
MIDRLKNVGRILKSDVLTPGTETPEHRIFCRIQESDLPSKKGRLKT